MVSRRQAKKRKNKKSLSQAVSPSMQEKVNAHVGSLMQTVGGLPAESGGNTPINPLQITNKIWAEEMGFENVLGWYNDIMQRTVDSDKDVAAKAQAQEREYYQNAEKDKAEWKKRTEHKPEEVKSGIETEKTKPNIIAEKGNATAVLRNDAELAKEEKKEKELSRSDKKLLDSVQKLTKSMDLSNNLEKKKGLGGYLQGKVQSAKNAFSLEGMAGLLGVRRDDGSLKGAILSSMLQRSDAKKEKAKFISNFGMFTEAGRGIKDPKKLTQEGSRRYEMLTKIREEKTILEQKSAAARAFGGELSESDQRRMKDLGAREGIVTGLAKKKTGPEKQQAPAATVEKEATPVSKEELLSGAAEGMKEGILAASPEEQKALKEMDPEMLQGIFRGALEELVNISDDQLKMLEKMVKAMPSEEDRLEAKKAEGAEPITIRQEQKIKDEASESSGFNLRDLIPKNMFSRIGGAAKAVGRGAMKLGGAVLRGVGGLAKGAAKALPGIASGAMKGIGKLGGLAKGALGKLGPVAMAAMAAYDGVQGYQNAAENLGIEGREATTGEKFSSAAGGIASGLTFGLLDEKSASKGIASFFGAGPEKAPTPTRVAQAAELATQREVMRQMENEDRKKEMAPPAVINNAPTSIVNNKTTNVQRVPVRNTEPTYNTRLRTYFA